MPSSACDDDTISFELTIVDSMAGAVEIVIASREIALVRSSGIKVLELM